MLPAPVLSPLVASTEGLQSPQTNGGKRRKTFDEKEVIGRVMLHQVWKLNIRGTILKYVWTNHVRNELDWSSRCHTNMEFHFAVAVMDKNWRMGKEEGR